MTGETDALGEYLVQCRFVTTSITRSSSGAMPGLRAERQATNRLRLTCRITQPPSYSGNFPDGFVRHEVYATGVTMICSK